jgi:O-acetyl-ADP-ribose deacetylase (regulator of RNase III)
MIKYVQGDLFEAPEDLIAHGCNCRNGFGSGVAAAMARKYPKAKAEFHDKFEEDGWRLGDVQFVQLVAKDHKYIANCATQYAYLPRGVKHADYDAIRTCMEKVKEFAKAKSLTIAMPKIGAGLAGGDWTVIEKILEEVFSDYDATVYYL